MPAASWRRAWKTGNLMLPRFGVMLRPSLGTAFTERYTSSLAAIPVSHFQQPDCAGDQTTQGTCGPSLQMELPECSQSCASLRTSKDTSALDSEKSLENWKASVTEQRGDYSRRLKLARLTSESGSSSWPTATTRDWKDTGDMSQSMVRKDGKMRLDTLGRVVQASPNSLGSRPESLDWRTPQANEAGAKVETLFTKDGQPARPGQRAYRKTPSGKMVLQSQTINQQVLMQSWATPRVCSAMAATITPEAANDPKRFPNLETQVGKQAWATPNVPNGGRSTTGSPDKQTKIQVLLHHQTGGKLNPRWVETLMGLPVGWTMPNCAAPAIIAPTSSDSSATALSQPQQSELFASSQGGSSNER